MHVTTIVLHGTPQDLEPALAAVGAGATVELDPFYLGRAADAFAERGGTVIAPHARDRQEPT